MKRNNVLAKFTTWSDLSRQGELTAAESDACEALELDLLQARPKTADEAFAILEVLIYNIECGQRSDGLDVEAARRVQGWLKPLDQSEPAPKRLRA